MSIAFVTQLNVVAGTPVHVTLYAAGVALAPSAAVVWSGMSADTTIVADATGYNITFGAPHGAIQLTATDGSSAGNLLFSVAAAPIQFTNP